MTKDKVKALEKALRELRGHLLRLGGDDCDDDYAFGYDAGLTTAGTEAAEIVADILRKFF